LALLAIGLVAICLALDNRGFVTMFDGSSWSAPSPVNGLTDGGFGVSCLSKTFCVVVANDGSAASYDGVTWTPEHLLYGYDVIGTSCATEDMCMAVDFAGNVSERI
jgi:hypothetical protein